MASGYIKSSSLIKTAIIIFLFLLIATIFYSCDNSVEPEEPEPGRRDYVWEKIDIGLNEFSFGHYCVDKDEGIWITNTNSNKRIPALVYMKDNKISYKGGYFNSTNGIWLNSVDDIWVCTSYGELHHYNGKDFDRHEQVKSDLYKRIVLMDMAGIAGKEIFAVGYAELNKDRYETRSVIYRFNGQNWREMDIPDMTAGLAGIDYDKSMGYYLIGAYDIAENLIPKNYIYRTPGSIEQISKGDYFISRIGDKHFLSHEDKIYDIVNGNLKLIVDMNSRFPMGFARGRNLKDIFTGAYRVKVSDPDSGSTYIGPGLGHYNGESYKFMYEVKEDMRFILLDKKAYVFVTQGYTGDYFLSGKLKQKGI